MPAPTELVDGRWQVIGAIRSAVIGTPRRVARHAIRVAAPAAAVGAVGGAGTLVCHAAGWPAGLFGPDAPASSAEGQGGGGGAVPATAMTWPAGFPDLMASAMGSSMLLPSPGATPFSPGPGIPGRPSGSGGGGGGAGGGGGGGGGGPGHPSIPGEPGTPSIPGLPDNPGDPVSVPEPQAAAMFVAFLALFAVVIWMRQRRAA
jgi:hypothetical protein